MCGDAVYAYTHRYLNKNPTRNPHLVSACRAYYYAS